MLAQSLPMSVLFPRHDRNVLSNNYRPQKRQRRRWRAPRAITIIRREERTATHPVRLVTMLRIQSPRKLESRDPRARTKGRDRIGIGRARV